MQLKLNAVSGILYVTQVAVLHGRKGSEVGEEVIAVLTKLRLDCNGVFRVDDAVARAGLCV